MKISCLIPVYNEAPRVVNVLSSIIQVKTLSEIVCVDDGSTDKSIEAISKFNEIKLIKHAENKGKCEAIRTGILHIQSEYILLMDADLVNIDPQEIDEIISKFEESQTAIDMLILRRKNDPPLAKIVRNDMIVTGERIIRTDLLRQILNEEINGYELEYAINNFMIKNNKTVKWVYSSAFNTMKRKKMKFLEASLKELKMFSNLWFKNKGVIKYNILNQMLFFHPEQLK